MRRFRTIELLRKCWTQHASDQEMRQLFDMLHREQGVAELHESLNAEWQTTDELAAPDIDSDALWSRISARITPQETQKLWVKWAWWSVSAAAVLALGILLGQLWQNPQTPIAQVPAGDMLKEVRSEKPNFEIFTLPDQTKVWLKNGSSLIYPLNFKGKTQRKVRLFGEGFFEVAHNARQPFVLQMGEVSLKVLGTSFNAANYAEDKHIEVVLKTGKVELSHNSNLSQHSTATLKPGQLADFNKTKGQFAVEKVDVNSYLLWMQGRLVMHDTPMGEALRKIGQWYNVKITMQDPQISRYVFTANIKNENLEQVLKLMKYTTPIDYRWMDGAHTELEIYARHKKTVSIH